MLERNHILENAKVKIEEFNRIGLHYNLVANQIYTKRLVEDTDPFSQYFLRYIVAGLISFNMERMMGKAKYDDQSGFLVRLKTKCSKIRSTLETLIDLRLTHIDLRQYEQAITESYGTFSANGSGALNEDRRDHFYVGAAKVLHFLNPELFIIVDSNAARAFRMAHNVKFTKSTQHGYSSERYIECMLFAQQDIMAYGEKQFEALDPGIPLTRIYDKLTFMTGIEDG